MNWGGDGGPSPFVLSGVDIFLFKENDEDSKGRRWSFKEDDEYVHHFSRFFYFKQKYILKSKFIWCGSHINIFSIKNKKKDLDVCFIIKR
jgi:hypothetical protein